MTEAGQIFALLRSASAAELAKRFNVFDDGQVQPPAPSPATTEGTVGPRGRGIGAPGTQAGQGASAALAATAASALSGADAEGPVRTFSETQPPGQGGPVRAAVSLGHIAPPRVDVLRLMSEGLQSRVAGGEAVAPAGAFPGTNGSAGAAGFGMGREGLHSAAGGVLAELQTARSPDSAALADAGPSDGSRHTPEADGAKLMSRDAVGGRAAAGAAALTVDVAARLDKAATAGGSEARPASAEARSSTPGPTGGAAQATAFAEALTALILADGSGRSTSIAAGVIFNAAMMPGWPFPTAFAKDGPDGINPKAMLHQLAAAIEGLSPEEAAAYMAKIGGGHAFLRSLRKLLKDLDLIEKDDVKGLLFAFLETISTIASGIQLAFKQMSESAALQEALANGADPDEGARPGRHRLRL